MNKDNLLNIKQCILLFGQLLKNGNTIHEAQSIVCNKFGISEWEFDYYLEIYRKNNSQYDDNENKNDLHLSIKKLKQ